MSTDIIPAILTVFAVFAVPFVLCIIDDLKARREDERRLRELDEARPLNPWSIK